MSMLVSFFSPPLVHNFPLDLPSVAQERNHPLVIPRIIAILLLRKAP
uniref:Uncharacterized protein n=1 Tax=Arundo donax TaxID=35708 RepID=A0A0A8ZNA4_ARUDO